jgi:LPS O-antigen subunit length determinant protein (WzzB/FepE family)
VEELTLRDVYLVYLRQRVLFWTLLFVFPLIGLLLGLFLPKSFASKAVLSLKLQSDQLNSQVQQSDQSVSGTQQIFSNLPSVPALVQAFQVGLESSQVKSAAGQVLGAKVQFDEKNGSLELTNIAAQPDLAKGNVEEIVVSASRFMSERVVGSLKSNVEARLARVSFDREITQANVDGLRAAKQQLRLSSDPVIAAGLEGQRVNPPVARSSDPSRVSLELQEAGLRAQLAGLDGTIKVLSSLIDDPKRLERLAGQVFQVQRLVPASLPASPDSPKLGFLVAVLTAIGLMMALFVPLVREAVSEPAKSSSGISPSALDKT